MKSLFKIIGLGFVGSIIGGGGGLFFGVIAGIIWIVSSSKTQSHSYYQPNCYNNELHPLQAAGYQPQKQGTQQAAGNQTLKEIESDEYSSFSAVNGDDMFEDDGFAINPASGLPMIAGIGSVDVEGNLYGFDSSDDYFSSSNDNNW